MHFGLAYEVLGPVSEDGWTPSPSVLGQMDPLGLSVLGWMDFPLDGWISLAYSERTLPVTFSIITLSVTCSITVTNALNRCH